MLFATLFFTTSIWGYILKIFESPLNDVTGQDFSSMQNCMWNVIITLTSVGYGDIYPKSLLGRITGCLVAFWGVCITSFFVVTVTNMLQFSQSEEKAYNLLLRLYYKTQLKKEAVGVL